MTEQQWQTIADRDRGGDMDAAVDALEDGDRVTYIYDTDPPDQVVRIERQVPTTENEALSTMVIRYRYAMGPAGEAEFDRWLEAHDAEVRTTAAPQPPTREQIAPLPDEARMDAYYYGFERTGVGFIDAILSAVAIAGKGAHHTESWGAPWEGTTDYFRGHPGLPDAEDAVDLIQKAAQQAADAVLALLQKGGEL